MPSLLLSGQLASHYDDFSPNLFEGLVNPLNVAVCRAVSWINPNISHASRNTFAVL